MSTTSLKLSDELRQRAAAAAVRRGVSPHAFMVEAIVAATTAAEQRESFIAEAEAARAAMLRSGKGYDADEAHAWLRDKAKGKSAAGRPKARAWRG